MLGREYILSNYVQIVFFFILITFLFLFLFSYCYRNKDVFVFLMEVVNYSLSSCIKGNYSAPAG